MFRSCPAVPIKFKWDAFCPVYFPLDSVAERSFFDFHKKKKNPPRKLHKKRDVVKIDFKINRYIRIVYRKLQIFTTNT